MRPGRFLCLGIASAVLGGGGNWWPSLGFFMPVSLYCAALSSGASRLRSRSSRVAASPWICASLLLHALSGWLGGAAFLLGALGAGSRSLGDPALDAAMFGMLFGFLPALPPFVCARRGGSLLLAAFLGPIVLFLAIHFSLRW